MVLSASTLAHARELTFEQRVAAQEAIERANYRHTIGASQPFERSVPREVLEQRVRAYLKETVALEIYWYTHITSEMLRREAERITRGTRLPERLREIRAALGNDEFLFQECVARATLVDRLARHFFASDQVLHAASWNKATALREDLLACRLDPSEEDPRRAVIEDGAEEAERPPALDGAPGEIGPIEEPPDALIVRVPLGEHAGRMRIAAYAVPKRTWDDWWAEASPALDETGVPAVASERETGPVYVDGCLPDDRWDNASLEVPDSLTNDTAVWTGSLMVLWSGSYGWRYDPATDTWSRMSTVGAPLGTYTAVWTGSRVIAWGGSTATNAGGLYDPVTDTWSPMTTIGAPSGRTYHSVIWTGSRMIVWGGGLSSGYTNTGGSYDPVTDTWTALSSINAPRARVMHTAVWTGTRMIVWGGFTSWLQPTNTGGIYDPVRDRWSATATTGAPFGRIEHAAVWTGTRMIVWGGTSTLSNFTNTGGIYDPLADTWFPTSTTGAPIARRELPPGIWTGTEMIVWGGVRDPGAVTNDGAIYDPSNNTWRPMSNVNAPPAYGDPPSAVWTGSSMIVFGGGSSKGGRYALDSDSWTPTYTVPLQERQGQTVVWTGTHMIVWGGGPGGGRYDPALDSWSDVSKTNAPEGRTGHTAIWTGSRMIVWGGSVGGRYNPVADAWEPISTDAAPDPRAGHTAVWTGTEMLVWGGTNGLSLDSGARYDPDADRWKSLSRAGAPAARYGHAAVWTGDRMVVWGGSPGLNTGARYDPTSDAWSPTAIAGAPSPRTGHTAVWDGSRMIVWGGTTGGSYLDGGGLYDPTADTWSPTALSGAPSPRTGHTAVWEGSRMIVWGGVTSGGPLGSGALYDPAADAWSPTSAADAPLPRWGHSAVWADGSMVVWGGLRGFFQYRVSGGRYVFGQFEDHDGDGITPCGGDCDDANPNAFPGAREVCDGADNDCDATVDSGVDADLDGFDACRDCDDANPAIFPGAPEVCDGVDNDCDEGTDNAPEICDGVDNDCNGKIDDFATPLPPPPLLFELHFTNRDVIRWGRPSGWTTRGYDVVRGNLGALLGGRGDFAHSLESCVEIESPDTPSFSVAGSPSRGQGWYYLIRALGCPKNGSYDDGAPSQVGGRDAEIESSPAACP